MKARIRGTQDLKTGYLRKAQGIFNELVFPAVCPVCHEPIAARIRFAHIGEEIIADPDAYACSKCREEFDRVVPPYCAKCGKQLLTANESGLCRDCALKGRSFIEARALLSYDELTRELLSGLKYHSMKETAYLFGLMCAEELGDFIKEKKIDLMVPVPVHPERLKKRGYNQAELIARGIEKKLDIPVAPDLLRRVKRTSAQKELGIAERLLNLDHAFDVNPRYAGKLRRLSPRILIVDDIYTTGATMEAVSEVLTGIGIKGIYGLTVAAGKDAPVIEKAGAL